MTKSNFFFKDLDKFYSLMPKAKPPIKDVFAKIRELGWIYFCLTGYLINCL